MITLSAAYQRAIDDTRMDRLIVACAFDCGVIPLGYREQLTRIPHVTAVGGEMWIAGHEQDERHRVTGMVVGEGMRSAGAGEIGRAAGEGKRGELGGRRYH